MDQPTTFDIVIFGDEIPVSNFQSRKSVFKILVEKIRSGISGMKNLVRNIRS